ncbi:Putative Rieske 2Fe-2S iron-sulfur protein [Fulvia fulva]|nr:putative Rieske 2Fe-2S iron-sulfur protein [Fulvia fulva]WPV15283.1 Putative Rieske 2Fe-2S iron-sulfur protein [Fulvia fulva]WPV30314.1 Putative Rieske 2Fe-2S iron-sulfur protein [Fulvia fulva]
MATVSENPPQPAADYFNATSGATEPVWVHTEPYSARPHFSKLERDVETDVCVVGAGIAGIQTSYELVTRGFNVVLLEAREILSGETGRTSGHLASALDDGYTLIAGKHGQEGAQIAADSHQWAINRVGDVAKKLGIDCEYRLLPGYEFSQYDRVKQPKEHAEENKELEEEVSKAQELGLKVEYDADFKLRGWDGEPDQRGAAIFRDQATFHPTKYLNGVLKWLKEQPNFHCFTHTRVMDFSEKGIEIGPIGHKTVELKTIDGYTVKAQDAIEYDRTYCIAIKVPKGYVEDALFYDEAEEYKYVRLTHCDAEHDYLVVGGCDHKEEPLGRFKELETWTRERFTKAGSVDYAWSGQVFEPVDFMAFIGRDPGTKHTWIMTGDSGNGLTHFVLGADIIATEISGQAHPWSKLYRPNRVASILKSGKQMLSHDLQINAQYKRFFQSDIEDIADLPNGEAGVLNPTTKTPTAVYKDDEGNVHKLSALCPHLKGVVCWNRTEKSWDCPVHGSRFSKDGVCVMGPAKGNLSPFDENAKQEQAKTGIEV